MQIFGANMKELDAFRQMAKRRTRGAFTLLAAAVLLGCIHLGASASDPCGGITNLSINATTTWAYLGEYVDGIDLTVIGGEDLDVNLGECDCDPGHYSSDIVLPDDATWSASSGNCDPATGDTTEWIPEVIGSNFTVTARVPDLGVPYDDAADGIATITVGAFEVYVMQAFGGTGISVSGGLQVARPSTSGPVTATFQNQTSGWASYITTGGTPASAKGATASWFFMKNPSTADHGTRVIEAKLRQYLDGTQEVGVDDADLWDGAASISLGLQLGPPGLAFGVGISWEYAGDCDEGVAAATWGYNVLGAGLGAFQNPENNYFEAASSVDDGDLNSVFCNDLNGYNPAWIMSTSTKTQSFFYDTGVLTTHKPPAGTAQVETYVLAHAAAHAQKTEQYGNGRGQAIVRDWNSTVMVQDVLFVSVP